jgi:hypothetical protein
MTVLCIKSAIEKKMHMTKQANSANSRSAVVYAAVTH